jgi:hypothetical protein
MAKKKEKDKKIIEKEIGILENLQEGIKFEFNGFFMTVVSFITVLLGFSLASISTGLRVGTIGGVIGIILVGAYYSFFKIHPLKKKYRKLDGMIEERYEQIGINWNILKSEFLN